MQRILYAIMPSADGGFLTFDYSRGMTMTWQKIVASLLQILAEQLGGWQGAGLLWLLEQLKRMGVLNTALPEGIRFSSEGGNVGAAPDEFKAAVKAFLDDLISKINRPLVKMLLGRLVPLLTDAVLDMLWDRLLTKSGDVPVGFSAEANDFAAEFEVATHAG